jgi:enamine deaminase RidA (YjgF/YER057c/UK114 family)
VAGKRRHHPAGVVAVLVIGILGAIAFIAGAVALMFNGYVEDPVTGRVGAEVDVEQAYEAARATGLSMLASLKRELGDLDRVTAWVKALGFVNCAEGFNATPAAINGFSDLIRALWGDAGRHARSAIGAGELPFGMPVEVEAVVALT